MILNSFAKRRADSLKLRLAERQAPCPTLRSPEGAIPIGLPLCKACPDLKRISFKLAFFLNPGYC